MMLNDRTTGTPGRAAVFLMLMCAWAVRVDAQVGPARITGRRYVGGVAERIHCFTRDPAGANWLHWNVRGERRFEIDASCPLSQDADVIVFAGREDNAVVSGVPGREWMFSGIVAGPLTGAASGELRVKRDGRISSDRGRLTYFLGDVIFIGNYLAQCDDAGGSCVRTGGE